MSWSLGVDVGTTFTAAAAFDSGHVNVFALETQEMATPTTIHAGDDGAMVFGARAVARSIAHPAGTAREFKRRLGDPVPVILSGSPYSADRLVALFVRWVVQQTSEESGSGPSAITVTHPANWSEYQLHLLQSSLTEVGLSGATFLSEPQAAATDFGATAQLADGDRVLVYDLGGGTFDVSVLERTGAEFHNLGDSAGIERLGGIDFDEAIYQHLLDNLPDEAVDAARRTREGQMALSQLRRSCVEAKEALSTEAATDVTVVLGEVTTSVRISRTEFEAMIAPMLSRTIELVHDVMTRRGLTASDLSAILLVGGSSRIPLVTELVGRELAVPVRVDAHPKLVVARGAARHAALTAGPVGSAAGSGDRSRGGRRALFVVGAIAALVALAAVAFLALSDGDSDETGDATTVVTTPATAVVTTPATTVEPASTTAPTTEAPATTTATTLAPRPRVEQLVELGTVEIPLDQTFEGRQFRAIDGFAARPDADGFLALKEPAPSDVAATDPSLADPVLFAVGLPLPDALEDPEGTGGTSRPVDIVPIGVLTDADGQPYGTELDIEGLVVLDDGSFVVVSEGSNEIENVGGPFIHRFDGEGTFVSEYPLPAWWVPSADGSTGVRDRQGLHGIDRRPGEPDQLIVVTEGPLAQDDDAGNPSEVKVARILALDIETGEPIREWGYALDVIPAEIAEQMDDPLGGIVDIAVLDDGTLIVLELSMATGTSQRVYYQVELDEGAEPSAASPPVVDKQLIEIGTNELARPSSITAGPTLDGDVSTLVIVTDSAYRDEPTSITAVALVVAE